MPGSAAALLEYRLGQDERAAIGFAVHVPHYLAQAAYPAAAVTLLEAVQRASGLVLPGDTLREAARRTDLEIARQVEGSAEVTEVVEALEQQYDAVRAAGRNLLGEEPGADADGRGAGGRVRAVPGRAAGPRRQPGILTAAAARAGRGRAS